MGFRTCVLTFTSCTVRKTVVIAENFLFLSLIFTVKVKVKLLRYKELYFVIVSKSYIKKVHIVKGRDSTYMCIVVFLF